LLLGDVILMQLIVSPLNPEQLILHVHKLLRCYIGVGRTVQFGVVIFDGVLTNVQQGFLHQVLVLQ